jgi:predicted nucleic acid-binding protein
MSLVFWDTMLFVYLLEEHPGFHRRVSEIRKRMLERGDRLCTSTLTLGELLAAPYARNQPQVAANYRAALSSPHVDLISFTEETAHLFGRIRSDRSIASPDAIQLACAAQARVDLFLTNDRRLARRTVPGIQFIADLSFDYL